MSDAYSWPQKAEKKIKFKKFISTQPKYTRFLNQ